MLYRPSRPVFVVKRSRTCRRPLFVTMESIHIVAPTSGVLPSLSRTLPLIVPSCDCAYKVAAATMAAKTKGRILERRFIENPPENLSVLPSRIFRSFPVGERIFHSRLLKCPEPQSTTSPNPPRHFRVPIARPRQLKGSLQFAPPFDDVPLQKRDQRCLYNDVRSGLRSGPNERVHRGVILGPAVR